MAWNLHDVLDDVLMFEIQYCCSMNEFLGKEFQNQLEANSNSTNNGKSDRTVVRTASQPLPDVRLESWVYFLQAVKVLTTAALSPSCVQDEIYYTWINIVCL